MSSLLVHSVERRLDAPAQARQQVRGSCHERIPDDLLVDVLLVVSELVTNALRYGAGDISLTLDVGPDEVLVSVADEGPDLPRRVPSGPDTEGGRGLGLVESVAVSWGVRPRRAGKVVWCRLRPRPAVD